MRTYKSENGLYDKKNLQLPVSSKAHDKREIILSLAITSERHLSEHRGKLHHVIET